MGKNPQRIHIFFRTVMLGLFGKKRWNCGAQIFVKVFHIGEAMKRSLITIFTLIYIMVSMGVTTVQHVCKIQRQTGEKREECSCRPAAEYEKGLITLSSQQDSCCSGAPDDSLPARSARLLKMQGQCCQDQAAFHLIDATTLSKPVDLDYDTTCPQGQSSAHDVHAHGICKLPILPVHPTKQLNLPLLI